MAAVTFTADWAIIANAAVVATIGPEPERHLQNTYIVTPRPYLVILQAAVLVAVFGFFAAWYHFFPKVTGCSYSDGLGRIQFWLSIGAVDALNLMEIAVPVLIILSDPESGILRSWNAVSPISGYVFVAGLLVFAGNMILSFVRRRSAL